MSWDSNTAHLNCASKANHAKLLICSQTTVKLFLIHALFLITNPVLLNSSHSQFSQLQLCRSIYCRRWSSSLSHLWECSTGVQAATDGNGKSRTSWMGLWQRHGNLQVKAQTFDLLAPLNQSAPFFTRSTVPCCVIKSSVSVHLLLEFCHLMLS